MKIISEVPPQPTLAPQWNGRAIALALVLAIGVIAALALAWQSDWFRNATSATTIGPDAVETSPAASALTPNEVAAAMTATSPNTEAANAASTKASTPDTASMAAEAQQQSDAPPSPVNAVIPDVPQSALQTIRGTVRVLIRVIIDKQGRVEAASADIPGPSRYFERLSLEAARKWTFTPANAAEERTMLVRFHFTRDGATARAEQPL